MDESALQNALETARYTRQPEDLWAAHSAIEEYARAGRLDERSLGYLTQYAAELHTQIRPWITRRLSGWPEPADLDWLRAGQALIAFRFPALAAQALRRGLQANPEDRIGRIELAQALGRLHGPALAVRVLEGGPSRPNDARYAAHLRFWRALAAGRSDPAVEGRVLSAPTEAERACSLGPPDGLGLWARCGSAFTEVVRRWQARNPMGLAPRRADPFVAEVLLDSEVVGLVCDPELADMFWYRYRIVGVGDAGNTSIHEDDLWRRCRLTFRDPATGQVCTTAWASGHRACVSEGFITLRAIIFDSDKWLEI